MARIRYFDFSNYVENNRKRLITHCRENGKDVSEKDSLFDIVTRNNEINIEGNCKVKFVDLDGSMLAPTQYVEVGGKATLPDIIPTFDSEYLEFVKWQTSAGDSLDNVTRDILVMPEYQVKYDEATGQRPTYLICYFDDDTLNPTFYFGSYSTTNYVNAYIDYGDGTVEQITKNSMPHTYTKKGLYIIKIYGDKYSIGGASGSGVFNNSIYKYALLKAYLSNNITSINNAAFYNCYSLTNIILPNSILSINNTAFQSCRSLTNIILPNSITSIGTSVFWGCSSLTNIILPNSITSIGTSVFSGCRSLTNIILPNSITSISGAFNDCSSLTNITLSNNILSIDSHAFQSCYSLTNIILPNSITSIGSNAFSFCSSLTDVILPNSIASIGSSAFEDCYSLTNIKLPNSILSIDDNAFSSCSSLTNIILPNDFNVSLSLKSSPLSTECLVNMANALKNNTDDTAKTLTLSKDKVYSRANSLIYLNANGEQVSKDTEGAMTLVEYMQNKNWTVTFA